MFSATSRGRHSNSDTPLGAILFLLIALIWFLVWTWPWSLLLPPGICFIALAFRPKLRSKVSIGFTREGVEPDIASLRRNLMRSFFVLSVISAVACIFAVGLDNLGWWLIPLTLFALALRLRSLSVQPGRWSLLKRALCTNLLELMLIASMVLIVYSFALWWFQSVSLDAMTLHKLLEWEKRVQDSHEFVEKHSPKIGLFLILLGIVLALRLAATIRPTLAGMTSGTTMLLAGAAKWVGRVSTLIAFAASLTFLASKEGGPATRITLVLRDAKQDYEHFQSVLAEQTDLVLRQSLLARAWTERPPALKATMARSAQFQRERDRFEEARHKAEESFQIRLAAPERFPLSVEIPSQQLTVSSVAEAELPSPATGLTSWTPKELHKAAAEVDALASPAVEKESGEKNEALDEIAKEVFDKLLPTDRFFEHTPFISVLKIHYPVFGEFLDAITSSVSEASFDTVRNSIVKQVIEKRATERDVPLATMIAVQVEEAVSTMHLDLSHFGSSWARATEANITTYIAGIGLATSRLERIAFQKQREQTQHAGQLTQERGHLLGEVSVAIDSNPLGEAAVAVQKYTAELTALGMNWPALSEPNPQLRDKLTAISTRIEDSGILQYQVAPERLLSPSLDPMSDIYVQPRSSSMIRPSAGLLIFKTSPIEVIATLNSYCDSRLLEAVAASSGSEEKSAKLRHVMGDRYASYYEVWQIQVQRQAAERQAEKKREIAEANRIAAERLENERRMEEMRRPIERPIEVP